ncbi:cysteine hydrolase family protein [Halalkalibacter oceani]|uniref:Cysteine hydrolase n=1 Tax=Halalkalibacter oceani TaxID=1653776 RepID=A0A9X2DRY1_9BACI|nr:isochorismatase family cysteine hydrolase [Halalkalibacter oceani]MCM3714088.1 cysteine hydrolase [Halalkalibacter oceani]
MEPPARSRYALLIIDMINDLEFEHGPCLFPYAFEAAKQIAILKKRLKAIGVPIIYVNDNYGRWQSDFPGIVDHCMQEGMTGKPIVELIKPDEDDYFVLKPKFSGFFATPLELLLTHLEVETLIITGVAGNMCVQFTANDAYMRDYKLIVPADCVASNTVDTNNEAIHLMRDVLKANVSPAKEIDFE